jgi:hypothetical protein
LRLFGRKPAPVEGSKTETEKTVEIPLGGRLVVEFTKIKKSEDSPQGKRVVTSRKKINWRGGGRFRFIQRGMNLHYVDTEQLKWTPPEKRRRGFWKLQFDENYCEPLGNDGVARRNPVVSMILRDETMMQLVQIAQLLLPIQITRTMAITVLVFGSMSFLLGLGFDSVFNTAPQTVVHWLTSPPVIK